MAGEVKFTAADYARLPEGFPAQLLEGELVKEPSRRAWHQELVGRLFTSLRAHLGERVLPSPLDVHLDDENILQPDVVVLRPEDVPPPDDWPRGCLVAVEVLSPSTAERDRGPKTRAYLRSGVAEVWLVDPASRTITLRTSRDSRVFEDVFESRVIPGFRLDVADLFRMP